MYGTHNNTFKTSHVSKRTTFFARSCVSPVTKGKRALKLHPIRIPQCRIVFGIF
jgi:hypothetical protein